jgi:hypothetical protein
MTLETTTDPTDIPCRSIAAMFNTTRWNPSALTRDERSSHGILLQTETWPAIHAMAHLLRSIPQAAQVPNL